MAHDNEVPDHLKESDHTIPLKDWETVRAEAAVFAAEDSEDIEVPDHEPADDDFDFEETPDEVTRGETLNG